MTVTVSQPPPSTAMRRVKVDRVEQITTYRNIRRKVDNIEAQRIMYVFDQLQRRLLLLGGFSALTAAQFEKFPPSCHRLRQLVAAEPVDQSELADATRDAIRDVSKSPGLCQVLRRKTEVRVLKQVELIDQLRAAMMTRLTTTQAEADDQIMATRLANSRRTDTQEQIDTVKTELGQVNGEKTAETQERYDRILKLKNDLDEVERATEQQKQQVMETTNAEKQKIITKSDNLQQQMIDQITPLTTDHKKLVTQHREAELEVRQRKFRLETEVDGLIAKYDDFMITQQDDIGVIQEEYDVEKEQLDELRARYEKLKVDYDRIIEERRLAAEEEERQRKELEMKTYNATVIQAFFRSYKVRKMLKAKAKKAKKGKKSKKSK